MSELLPEAQQVLKYLVANYTPETRTTESAIEQATNLHGIALNDAIDDLEANGLVEIDQYSHIRPRPSAWAQAGDAEVGFNVIEDAVKVAQAANKVQVQTDDVHATIEAQDLEQATGLPAQRLNIAALWLAEDGKITLGRWMGTQPYAFGDAKATYETRKWLREVRDL